MATEQPIQPIQPIQPTQLARLEQFLRNKKELCYIDKKKYVELSVFAKYLGHESVQLDNISAMCCNNRCYISTEFAERLMTTAYNKDNPEVVQYHKEMGITGMEYTRGTKTLGAVKGTFDKLGLAMVTAGNNIGSAFELKSSSDSKTKDNNSGFFSELLK